MANHVPDALKAVPYCPDCGATRLPESKFCPHCGCSFTGQVRAKGAPPSVPPVTRPMMPAVRTPLSTGPVDIEVLEGIERAVVLPLPRRPRTAVAANADEPDILRGGEAPLGLGVTSLPISMLSGAARPDEPDFIAGLSPRHAPVGAMYLHVVTSGMAQVDDVAPIGAQLPGSTSASSTAASSTSASSTAASSTAAATPSVPRVAAAGPLDVIVAELTGRGTITTSAFGLADDPAALGSGPPFAIGLGVTHLAAVLADSALVDDPILLGGGKPTATHIPRGTIDEVAGIASHVDDAAVLAPAVRPAPAPDTATAPRLAHDWADVAERPIPRKDDRANVAVVPRQREVFFADEKPAEPAAPPPEPLVQYTAAAPPGPAAAAPAPWASLQALAAPPAPATPPAPASAAAPPPPAAPRPGAATMMMSLDAAELRALAERLVEKGAVSAEDLHAAKKKP